MTSEQPTDVVRFIDTEAWIDEWWREVNPSAIPPTKVVDASRAHELLDGEVIPYEELMAILPREAICSRCGHREYVSPNLLIAPPCPVCKAPMRWLGD